MIPRHEDGRLHVGALFKEASDHCTDECATGHVCFEHMTARLHEVRDLLREKELQISELKGRVQNEHECAEELKEGLIKQHSDHCDELDAKDKLIEKLQAEGIRVDGDRDRLNRLNGELRGEFMNLVEALDVEWKKGDGLFRTTIAALERARAALADKRSGSSPTVADVVHAHCPCGCHRSTSECCGCPGTR